MAKRGFNKFHNNTFTNAEGKWDSTLEYRRWLYLKDLQKRGLIEDLMRQVRFELIPKQTRIEIVQLKTKTKEVERVVEQNVEYVADFVYYIKGSGDSCVRIIEDTKSSITRNQPDYKIKRKLMRLQGNPIIEITSPTQNI